MEELTIANLLKGTLPRLKVNETGCSEYEAEHPFGNIYPLIEKATYVGLECEIENVGQGTYKGINDPYWTKTKDGSLRNNGVEFISIPLKVTRVEQALHILFNQTLGPGISYSPRTSVHVHVNVRTLTLQQLESLVLTYMIFERAIFNWVGNERHKNIYCVPLYDVVIQRNFCNKLIANNITWEKYTALNLRPVYDRGTIEFRHLEGTNDIKRIMTWINILLSFKMFALRNNPQYIREKILSLNTTSDYHGFTQEVFGELLAKQLDYLNFNTDMSDCISGIKAQCLINPIQVSTSIKYMNFLKKKFNIKSQKPENYKAIDAPVRPGTARPFFTNAFTL